MENSLDLKNKVKVIALDFDGVITNLNVDWNSAIRLASTITGYNIKSLLTFYESSHGTPIFQKVSEEIEKLELDALRNAEPTRFVKEFLQEISKHFRETYIVSIQSAFVVEKFLRQHDLACYFKEVLTRERLPSRRAQIAYILEKSRVSPDEVLLVDDSGKNIAICKELGITCFYFARGQNPRKTKQMWDSILDLAERKVS
jgi:phosphoglycolate phosphatase-like HAD superfamily hydrolase